MQLIPSDSGVYSMINYDMDKKDNISPRVFQKIFNRNYKKISNPLCKKTLIRRHHSLESVLSNQIKNRKMLLNSIGSTGSLCNADNSSLASLSNSSLEDTTIDHLKQKKFNSNLELESEFTNELNYMFNFDSDLDSLTQYKEIVPVKKRAEQKLSPKVLQAKQFFESNTQKFDSSIENFDITLSSSGSLSLKLNSDTLFDGVNDSLLLKRYNLVKNLMKNNKTQVNSISEQITAGKILDELSKNEAENTQLIQFFSKLINKGDKIAIEANTQNETLEKPKQTTSDNKTCVELYKRLCEKIQIDVDATTPKRVSHLKPSDETLKDAENISDIEECDVDYWIDFGIKKDNIIKMGLTPQNDSKKNFRADDKKSIDKSNSSDEDNAKKDDDDDFKENDDKQQEDVDSKDNKKSLNYRCDAIVMYDYENNINFCKLCKLTSMEPPVLLMNGDSKFTQTDYVNTQDTKNNQRDEIVPTFKVAQFTQKNTQDEEIVKKRARDSMQFWKNTEMSGASLNEKRYVPPSRIPTYENSRISKIKDKLINNKKDDELVSSNKEENKMQAASLNDSACFSSGQSPNKTLDTSCHASRSTLNIKQPEFDEEQENHDDDDDDDMEEVEVVITLDSYEPTLGQNDYENENQKLSKQDENRRLEEIIMELVPSKRKAYLNDIIDGIKNLMKNDLDKINTKYDFPDEVILYIKHRYDSLVNEQENFSQSSSSTSLSDSLENSHSSLRNSFETTELTVVKDYHEETMSSNCMRQKVAGNEYDNDDELNGMKVKEETLYIVERKKHNSPELSILDNEIEIRKNFELKNKCPEIETYQKNNEEKQFKSKSNCLFNLSGDGLYDLNKIVAGRIENSLVQEQYRNFKYNFSRFIDDIKQLNENVDYKMNNELNDYQLHFVNFTNDSSNTLESTNTLVLNNQPKTILMLSYDKNNQDNFNFTDENYLTSQVSPQKMVYARIQLFVLNEQDDNDQIEDFFERFSIIQKPNDNFNIREDTLVHLKYYSFSFSNTTNKTDLFATGSKESLIDASYLPYAIRLELYNESRKYLASINDKTKRINGNFDIKYQNDSLELPVVSVFVLESSLIQNAINIKRDETIRNVVKAHSESNIDQLDNCMNQLEEELNSYIICEKLVDRQTGETNIDDLVKLNKLDALVSFEIFQKYVKLFEKESLFGLTIEQDKYDTKKFILIDNGNYFKCILPNDTDEENDNLDNSLRQSNSVIIKTMNKRQNYIFSKHLRSAIPLENFLNNENDQNNLKIIRSVRFKQPKIHKKASMIFDDEFDNSSYSLTVPSKSQPDKSYKVTINYDKNKNVSSEVVESQNEVNCVEVQTENKELIETGLQVNLIDENSQYEQSYAAEDLSDSSAKKTLSTLESNSATRNVLLQKSSFLKDNKFCQLSNLDIFDYEDYVDQQYQTMKNNKYLKFDESDIKSMERKLIRDDIVMKEIDKMFHSIRTHGCSEEKTDAEKNYKLNGKNKSATWSYSAQKRHVRAKIMEFSSKKETKSNLFIRIDDFLNQNISQPLKRSYSVDYLNQRTSTRSRINYANIPDEIPKSENITHYQHDILPTEYRQMPYGLRYWSILKLLEEEKASGQSYVFLGDSQAGDFSKNWHQTSSIIKEILTGQLTDQNLIISDTQKALNDNFHLNNDELRDFMSTNNIDDNIKMIKINEKIMPPSYNSQQRDFYGENLLSFSNSRVRPASTGPNVFMRDYNEVINEENVLKMLGQAQSPTPIKQHYFYEYQPNQSENLNYFTSYYES